MTRNCCKACQGDSNSWRQSLPPSQSMTSNPSSEPTVIDPDEHKNVFRKLEGSSERMYENQESESNIRDNDDLNQYETPGLMEYLSM